MAGVRDGSEVVVTDDGYQVASIVPRAAHGPARFTRRLRGSGPRFVPEPIEIDITDEELDRIVQESR